MIAIAAGAALVLFLGIVLVWLLRRRETPIDTAEEAARAAEATLAGFVAADAVVGSDGRAALAVGRDGRIAAIRRRGRRVAVSEVAWSSIRATASGMVVEGGRRRARDLVILGVDALDMRRLAAAGGRVAMAPLQG